MAKVDNIIDKKRESSKTVIPEAQFTQQGNSATLSMVTKKRIKTLNDLIKEAEIDTDVWEVERFTCNKWEVASKYRDQSLRWEKGVIDGSAIRKNEWLIQDLWQVKATMKKRVDAIALRELKELILAEIEKGSPKIPKKNYPQVPEACLCEIDFFDIHFGKLAWGLESGENYDLKIARRRVLGATQEMLKRIEPYNVERFLFPIGNDYFNVNSSTGTTYGGTPQSEDDRWKKTFAEGWRLLADVVYMLEQKAPVDILTIPGNHDLESAFYLGEVLYAHYGKNENVRVDNSPPVRKYYRYGKNLIGFTHGKDEKIVELPLIMANERSDDFAQTKFREWHLGDKHHKMEYHFIGTKEVKGVTVRFLRSLTATDQWHYSKGYISNIKAGEAFIWHKTQGLICNLSVNI